MGLPPASHSIVKKADLEHHQQLIDETKLKELQDELSRSVIVEQPQKAARVIYRSFSSISTEHEIMFV